MFKKTTVETSKLQAPSSREAPNSKLQTESHAYAYFGCWRLEFLWSLELGVWCFPLVALLLFLAGGCANPIGASKVSSKIAYRQATASALEGRLSSQSSLILHRFDLEEQFDKHPAATLRQLHVKARQDDRRDLVFALAELSYLTAHRFEHSVKYGEPELARDYYLCSAIYAYLYAFGPGREPPANRFDDRLQIIRDIYNSGLAKGLAPPNDTNAVVVLEDGSRELPPGPIQIRLDTNSLPFSIDRFEKFLSADQFLVRGLTVRNRQSGVGAPLIGVSRFFVGDGYKRYMPLSIFGQAPGDVNAWSSGELTLTLQVFSGYEGGTVQVNSNAIPLATDITAPLAYSLNDSFVWGLGMGQFLSSEEKVKSDVYIGQTYQPGRIPVVFVHGTFSSPVWWAEMMNTLRSDPEICRHYQFWFYIYNSGNPVVYSATKLRDCLTAKIQTIDPEGKDPALQQMVVIGHSQGGLLTKLTATDSGDLLWKSFGIKTLDDPKLTKNQLDLIKRYTVYEHLPFVKRVVFISTPHRGSYLASNFARRFVRRLVKMPSTLVQHTKELTGIAETLKIQKMEGVPTSLDSMSPSNKFLLTLADIPPAPGIKCNSIIAVEGDGDYHQGKDGLVAYSSAHVDYAESEFIVRSFHSCQDKPATIEEVRRILLEHLQAQPSGTTATPISKTH
jgi:pimeloyl-ACP methyl ester carboxylesterase